MKFSPKHLAFLLVIVAVALLLWLWPEKSTGTGTGEGKNPSAVEKPNVPNTTLRKTFVPPQAIGTATQPTSPMPVVDDAGNPVIEYRIVSLDTNLSTIEDIARSTEAAPLTVAGFLGYYDLRAPQDLALLSTGHLGTLVSEDALNKLREGVPLKLTRTALVRVKAVMQGALVGGIQVHMSSTIDWDHRLPPLTSPFFDEQNKSLLPPSLHSHTFLLDAVGDSPYVSVIPGESYHFEPGFQGGAIPRMRVFHPGEMATAFISPIQQWSVSGSVAGGLEYWPAGTSVKVSALSTQDGLRMLRGLGQTPLEPDGNFFVPFGAYRGKVVVLLDYQGRLLEIADADVDERRDYFVGDHLQTHLVAATRVGCRDESGGAVTTAKVSLIGDRGKYIQHASTDDQGIVNLHVPLHMTDFRISFTAAEFLPVEYPSISFADVLALGDVVFRKEPKELRLALSISQPSSSYRGWEVVWVDAGGKVVANDLMHGSSGELRLAEKATFIKVYDPESGHISDWRAVSPESSEGLRFDVVQGGFLDLTFEPSPMVRIRVVDESGRSIYSRSVSGKSSARDIVLYPNMKHTVRIQSGDTTQEREVAVAPKERLRVTFD